jgi:hypothetical protein
MTAPLKSSTRLDAATVESLNPIPVIIVGAPHNPITSVEQLANLLKTGQFIADRILVIYGDNLEIIKDPGILAINPMKLILVGVHIAESNEDDSLEQLMLGSDWCTDLYGRLEVVNAPSVQAAIIRPAEKEYLTQKPFRMVYSAKTSSELVRAIRF